MTNLFKFLYPFIKENMPKAVVSIVLSIFLAFIKTYQAYLTKDLVDNGLSKSTTMDDVLILVGTLVVLGLVNYPVRFFHFYLIRYVVDRGVCMIRTSVYSKLQSLKMSFFNNSSVGNLISQVMNDTQVVSLGFRGIVDVIREAVTTFSLIFLLLYRDWQLTVILLVITPFLIWFFNRSGKKLKRNIHQVQTKIADATHVVLEDLSGQKIIKAFNLRDYALRRFSKTLDEHFWTQMKTTKIEENTHPLTELIGILAVACIIFFAHFRIASGDITPGDFVSFVTALALLMDPVRKYSESYLRVSQAKAGYERVKKVLDLEEENDDGLIDKLDFKSSIEFKNVSFSIEGKKILDNVSFKVQKGRKVALVGASGAGKSTIINLLLRLYTIDEGDILIDGININDLKLSTLRDCFGLVNQEIFLFNDSIRENLCMGNSYSEEKIQEALEISNSKEFVDKLDLQVDTQIGERGAKLSGGQKQRLTIARAFLNNAPVLLLDEATSALDNESERVVQHAIDKVSSDKTVISVAHRLSTIQNSDMIFVLNDGKLIEQGSHKELIEKRTGEYYKLYQLTTK